MLTVLMATHNGAGTLPAVLDAYEKLAPPQGGWKLVVVNNGSTDQTQEILDSFQLRLPLTCVFEPKPGKNQALNLGLSKISGDLIVMTDDDALPDRDWLWQLRDTADSHPSFSVFGGAIVPQWEAPPPDWILPFSYILAVTNPAWEEGPIVASRIYGPNMAVRAQIVEAGYRFDTSLGPTGSRYQMGDESDFLQRVSKAGFLSWHCKRAIVRHIVRKSQIDKSWMLRRARAAGRADYRWEYLQYDEYLKPVPALLLGMPRFVVREIIEQALRASVVSVSRNSDRAFKEHWRLHYLVGRAMGGRLLYKLQAGARAGAEIQSAASPGIRADDLLGSEESSRQR